MGLVLYHKINQGNCITYEGNSIDVIVRNIESSRVKFEIRGLPDITELFLSKSDKYFPITKDIGMRIGKIVFNTVKIDYKAPKEYNMVRADYS